LERAAIFRPASYNESTKHYAPPTRDDEVIAIMHRAEAELGKPCHLWPSMREHQRTRESEDAKMTGPA
jgi:hypothetical protein